MTSWWIFLSLLTPFLWGVVNLSDRFLCFKSVRNEYALTFVSSMVRLPLFFLFLAFSSWFFPDAKNLLLVLLAGFLYVFPFLFYYRALRTEETSRVMLLYYAASPLVTFIYSTGFLGERFSSYDLIGSLLLLMAAFLSIVKFEKGFFHFRTAALWVLWSSALWPASDVIIKYLTPAFPSPLNLQAWMSLGGFFAGFVFLLFPDFSKQCTPEHFRWPRSSWLIYLANTAVFNVGLFTFLVALSLERVALTVVLTATQPLMVFLLELLVRKWKPELYAADTTLSSVLAKSGAFLCTIAGVLLFTF